MKKILWYYVILFLFFTITIAKLISINSNSLLYQEKLLNKNNIYIYGSSAPRGRILDCNNKIIVDNIGVKSIYYNKIKGITKDQELEIASTIANIINTKEGNINELKYYYLAKNNNGNDLITNEEYEMFKNRKLSNDDLYCRRSKIRKKMQKKMVKRKKRKKKRVKKREIPI